MDFIGTCSLEDITCSCKKTIQGYLENTGLIEKPPSFVSQVSHYINNALVQIGLLTPEPKWTSDDHMKSQLNVLAVVMIIFSITIIAKVIISKRSSKPNNLSQKEVIHECSQVKDFLRDPADRNCLPDDLDSQGQHTIDILYDGLPIPGSPFVVNVRRGCDPSKCPANGPGLEQRIVDKSNKTKGDQYRKEPETTQTQQQMKERGTKKWQSYLRAMGEVLVDGRGRGEGEGGKFVFARALKN